MTKKDFELIAKAIRDAYTAMDEEATDHRDGTRYCAYRLASALAAANPRFDRERFLTACGVQS